MSYPADWMASFTAYSHIPRRVLLGRMLIPVAVYFVCF